MRLKNCRVPTIDLFTPYEVAGRHTSVSVTGDAIALEPDERELAKGPATALRDAITRGIAAIAESVTPATMRRRRAEGSSSTKLFNSTGHLADGLSVEAQPDGSYHIAAPPDRLQPSRFGRADLERVIARLRAAVPALRDPTTVVELKQALEQTVREALIRVRRR